MEGVSASSSSSHWQFEKEEIRTTLFNFLKKKRPAIEIPEMRSHFRGASWAIATSTMIQKKPPPHHRPPYLTVGKLQIVRQTTTWATYYTTYNSSRDASHQVTVTITMMKERAQRTFKISKNNAISSFDQHLEKNQHSTAARFPVNQNQKKVFSYV